MRIIRDPETVYNCYIQEHVTDFCSQPPSAFHLRFYEEGEFLCSPMQPADCLLLLLDGTIYLYGLNQSGRYLPISARSDVMLLGDFEYATGTETQFFAEARSRIRCPQQLMNTPFPSRGKPARSGWPNPFTIKFRYPFSAGNRAKSGSVYS